MKDSLFAALYLDENVDVLVAAMLRARGFDVATTHERQKTGASDPQQLLFAIEEARCIVTHNRNDFVVLHTQSVNNNQSHMGIIVAAMRRPGEIVDRITHLLDTYTADEIAGQLFYV
jgi:predicted nuclease of predicted toxin-antitoxin system